MSKNIMCLAFVLTLGACATTEPSTPLTPAEQAVRDRQEQARKVEQDRRQLIDQGFNGGSPLNY